VTQRMSVIAKMRMLGATISAVQYWIGWAWRIYRLASTAQDRVSITRFILLRGLSRYMKQGDTMIYLDGAKYCIGVRTREIDTLLELRNDRVYDRVREFIPSMGWVVFDIGANVGMFTVQQARRGAKVYAFEPNPDVYKRLVQTVVANGVTDTVQTFQYALGSTPGIGAFRVPLGMTTLGSVISTVSSDDNIVVRVDITSLDYILPPDITRIDLLKIDVEGAEVEVLQGAIRTLKIVQRLIIECHSPDLLKQVIAFLDKRDFYCETHMDTNTEAGVDLVYAVRIP